MSEGLHVIISGRVQGVGFRFATQREALRLRLRGWVKNLSDGRVEAYFEGDKDSLTAVLQWCHVGPRWASVSDVRAEWTTGKQQYDAFYIIG